MQDIIIFGTGDLPEIAYYWLRRDSDYRVVAFTVDGEYVREDSFAGKPVVAFESLGSQFPPTRFKMLVAVGYSKMNRLRAKKCATAKDLGYELISYVHSDTILPENVVTGENVLIMDNNTIQPFVRIGDNVVIWSRNTIGHHTVIKDNCFISSEVVCAGRVEIGENCFVGPNSTIRDHLKIGPGCFIGPGSIILSDTEADGVYTTQAAVRSAVPSSRLIKI